MVTVVNPSGNPDIDGVLWGWRYSTNSLSFSFPTGSTEYSSYAQVKDFQVFNTAQANAARQALDNIASFANLTFNEITTAGAQLRFAQASAIDYTDSSTAAQHYGLHTIDTAEGNAPTLRDGDTPPFTPGYAQGDTWFNPNNYDTPSAGSYQQTAGIMHELGHAMGLKHGHATQVGHSVTFPVLPADHDSQEYSVMTYRQFPGNPIQPLNNRDFATTYMQDDIAALQYMYGANYNYHSESTTYSWSPTTGQEFINGVGQVDRNGAKGPSDGEIFMTVWDGGGNDTYDFSNFTTDMTIDLAPGGYTVLDTSSSHRQRADLGYDSATGGADHYARGNIFNALVDPNSPTETASLIDNAYGGSGNDSLLGNTLSNILFGRGGADTLKGGGGSDYLFGEDGADTLKGGGGADQLYGGNDNDTMQGGEGADTLDGGAGINIADYSDSTTGVSVSLASHVGYFGTAEGDALYGIQNLYGSRYGDSLSGDAAANALSGDDGDDTLTGNGGADTLDGGAGNNWASYAGSGAAVTVSLLTRTGSGGDAQGDRLVAIQNLVGSTAYGDTLTGDGSVNIIYGYGGNDTINAGTGADTAYAGDGDDRVVEADAISFDYDDGGSGIDTIDYSANEFDSRVTINLQTGQAVVSGGNTETILNFENVEGSQGSETIVGSDADNVLSGNGGYDSLRGGGGNDTLAGGVGADSLDGGSGVNTASYAASAAAVSVNLQAGTASGGDAVGDVLANIQNLQGSAFADALTGADTANVLDGGGGADTMTGGNGDDTYLVDSATDQAVEVAGGGTDQVLTTVSYALAAGTAIEALRVRDGTTTTAVNLTGNALANVLAGNGGANVLDGGAGADTMTGGGGSDTYYVDNGADGVIEAVGGGNDRVLTSVSYALAAGSEVEALLVRTPGTTSSVNLTGNAFANALTGNEGTNILDGGGGVDVMTGAGGNDTYYVDSAADQVVELAGGGTDQVLTTVSYALGAGNDVETLRVRDAATTTAVNLTGSSIANTLNGNAGGNLLDGGAGADRMYGYGGNDTYYVDNIGDQVFEAAASGIDRVLTSVSWVLTASQEVEALLTRDALGTTAIDLTGNSLVNTITGNAGANVLDGYGGNDTLYGQDGHDTFLFDTALNATSNVARIGDFMLTGASSDLIDLSHTIFGALGVGGLSASAFTTGTEATTASQHVIYNASTGALTYDSNGNAAGGSTQFATLTANLALTASSFQVV